MHAYQYEVIVDNVSTLNSSGIFTENNTYSLYVNDGHLDKFVFGKNLTQTFESDGHSVKIVFKDTNSTSIKIFTAVNQAEFLDINLL